ncbi:MAG: CHAT domain-containing protein [Pelomonas sp.]|nr:CHAT domain-containing protein [Roseateles sp.]
MSQPGSAARRWRALLFAFAFACTLGALVAPPPARAQGDDQEFPPDPAAAQPAGLDAAGAQLLLAAPLPADADARYALLQRQWQAAQLVNDRARYVAVLALLADAGRGRPGGEVWIRRYVSAEYTSGNSGKALEACEAYVTDARLSLATRAAVALRQAYFTAASGDRGVLGRLWSRADALSTQALAAGGPGTEFLDVDRLQVRSELERRDGRMDASVATLREGVAAARRIVAAERPSRANRMTNAVQANEALDAYGWLDGTEGMLVYALLRLDRAPEAIAIAEAKIAAWRAGQIDDYFGARWHYRLAAGLVETQQYAPAFDAARSAEDMLARSGSAADSHTRWLAREALVRSLIGLKRWQEADARYAEFLAQLGGDALALERARDNRLVALLAAKAGRVDEALDVAERTYRYRVRLYGADSPQVREAAGVRAVVLLQRGDAARALHDYDALFAATLDNPGGWLDLDARGLRGFVLGIAFDAFLDFVTERTLAGVALDEAVIDRARQVVDRTSLGATQRALGDSTARVLAATPALRALLDAEQTQRQQLAARFGALTGLLADEDRLRKQIAAPEFKALPPDARKAVAAQLQALRDDVRARQAGAAEAREQLARQRAAIAQQYPAYADLVMPRTASAAELGAKLARGSAAEALLVIAPREQATLVWLVDADGRASFAVARVGAAALAARVAQLRADLDLAQAPAGRAPALPLNELYGLYRDLLAPLEPHLGSTRSLIVATDGPLASLPLAALVTAPPATGTAPAWLLRRMAVTQLPAASALLALRRGADAAPAVKALLGFGDPRFDLGPAAASAATPTAGAAAMRVIGAPLKRDAASYDAALGFRYADVPPLPDTRLELEAVARVLGADPRTDLVLGAAATRRAVLDAKLDDRRVVAFATHGVMPGELPGVSKPALAMAADADPQASPLLDLDDVLGLRLHARWVLLSACNTAAGEAGGPAMSGLVRGFFFAGAQAVLATHWGVESESAAALTAATFAAQAPTRAAALREAQLAMLDGRLGAGQWTHPFYWAGYALFGDPGP